MKASAVRISIELPRDLHCCLDEAAARKLILVGIERAVKESKSARPKRRLSLDPLLIPPAMAVAGAGGRSYRVFAADPARLS